MKKVYSVPDGYELRVLADGDRLKSGYVEPLAAVWNADRARHGGEHSRFDGTVFAVFDTEGHTRTAYVMRRTDEGDKTVALLKYNPALHHCRENLKEVKV